MATIDAMTKQNDFLQPLLEMMTKRMDTLEQKIDSNTRTTQQVLEQAKYTNGRVTKLENKRLNRFSLSPALIYVIAIGFVLLLAIIATVLKIDVGGLLHG